MKRAFVYLRVSSGEQAKGFSLDAQFDEIKKFCENKEIIIVESFSDSMSGKKLTERKSLMELLDRIDVDKPNFVIATESDRISRNTLQFGWIDTHLSMKGVKLLLVNEREAEGPFEKAFQKIRAVFSEFETDLRQSRINRGREKARGNSRFMNRPPFGYKVIGKEVVVDTEFKQSVEMIFNDYFNHVSIKRIAKKIGKSPGSIRYILSNHFYIDSNLNGKHEIFVCKKIFERAQIKLKISKQLSTKR
ncbi:MAG: recombinase family protein [Melioribacteraceae bacterium]|nr:recombinase family protein [Melioribacteraceae bacterium]